MQRRRILAVAVALAVALPLAARGAGPSIGELKRKVEGHVKQNDPVAAGEAIEEIAALNNAEAAKYLLEAVSTYAHPTLQQAIRRGFDRIVEPAAVDVLAKKLGSPNGPWEARVVLADAFGDRSDDVTFDALAKALSDKVDSVQRTAVASLVKRHDKRAIGAIVDLLEKEEKEQGLVWDACRKALTGLTGESFEKAVDWRSWWAGKKDSFDLEKDKGTKKEASTISRRPKFFGQEIVSKRIVFVIDVSGSMEFVDPEPTEGPGGPRPETGKGRKEGEGAEGRKPASRKRIDLARFELEEAIRLLPSDVRFTVIAYSGPSQAGVKPPTGAEADKFVHVLKPQLFPADAAGKKAALAFVEQFKAEGATFTDRALMTAFQVKGADTIILLSDGAPMEWNDSGGFVTPADVLGHVKTWNQFRKVVIDTFGFEGEIPGAGGRGGNSGDFLQFMKDLAAQNGGQFHPVR